MKKYSLIGILLILMLTTLLTSCSRKFGCYYSIDYPDMLLPTDVMQPEGAIENTALLTTICPEQ